MLSAVDVKKILQRYMNTEREVENQAERLELLEQKIYSVGSPKISDMPRNPSPESDRLADLVERKTILEQKIRSLINEQKETRKYIEDVVDNIWGSDQRAVIRMRYIDAEKWESVSFMMFGSQEDYNEKADSYLRRVMILHGQALQEMAAIMNEKGSFKAP